MFLIKNILLRMNLRLQDARSECYAGAAAMAGAKTGAATQIKAIYGKCLYTHCYGHALNLAVGDSIKSAACLKEVFEVVHEIFKLIKKSPKRNMKPDEMRKQPNNDSKGIHALCPTRWTVRGEALEYILKNYDELMNLWDWSIDITANAWEEEAETCWLFNINIWSRKKVIFGSLSYPVLP